MFVSMEAARVRVSGINRSPIIVYVGLIGRAGSMRRWRAVRRLPLVYHGSDVQFN